MIFYTIIVYYIFFYIYLTDNTIINHIIVLYLKLDLYVQNFANF